MLRRSLLTLSFFVLLKALSVAPLATLLAPPAVGQAICQVPTSYPSIQSGVDDPTCDVLVVAAGTFLENVAINRSVEIRGQGIDITIVDGGHTDRVFDIQFSPAVTLTNLSVVNGYAAGGAGISTYDSSLTLDAVAVMSNTMPIDISADGGGISAAADSAGHRLSISRSHIQGNAATARGGGIHVRHLDGVIYDSLITDNESTSGCGGGIDVLGPDPGSGLPSTLTIQQSVVSSNAASAGGGICNGVSSTLTITNVLIADNSVTFWGGGIANEGTATLFGSTVTGNLASGDGGGLHNGYDATMVIESTTFSENEASSSYGGAIFIANYGDVTIDNSTLSGNAASIGGGVYYSYRAVAAINSSTISGNSAVNGGGGIYADGGGSLSLRNNIVAGSISGGDCSGTGIIINSYNLIEDGTCFPDLSGDPMLGSLQDNGGPNWTHALLPGGPAIDTGDNLHCPDVDQRLALRPMDGDDDGARTCDLGSFELWLPDWFIYLPSMFGGPT